MQNKELIVELSKVAKNITVLCVEDDLDFLITLKNTLMRFDFLVTVIDNPVDALELYKVKKFDLVISDLSMPGMDGISMIEAIKKINIYQKVMVVSAFGDIEDLRKMINLGVTKFINKPLIKEVFIQALFELCESIVNTKRIKEETLHLSKQLDTQTNILEQYKYAIDIATFVSKTNSKGVITYVNDAFCNITGYSRDELLGKTHKLLRSSNVSSELYKEMWTTIRAKKVWSGYLENIRKNGTPYNIKITIIPIVNIDGEIDEYISVRQDVSELKKQQSTELSEKLTKATQIHLEDTIQKIPLPTVVIDLDSIIVGSNTLFESEMIGSCALGKNLEKYFIQKEECLYSEGFIDWRDSVVSGHNKVAVVVHGVTRVFSLYIQALDEEHDIICFSELIES